jgi:Fe-S oxidoreductase
MSPSAGYNLGVTGYVFFWVLFAAALVLFIPRVYRLVSLLRLGRPENRFDRPARRFAGMLAAAITQSSNLKSLTFKDPAALGHAFMFWGLGVFLIGYIVFIGLGAGLGLFPVPGGTGFEKAFFTVLDFAGALVVLAMVWVVVKRYIIRPERWVRQEPPGERVVQPLLIAVVTCLMALYYLIVGFGYAAYAIPGSWPPVGAALANSLDGVSRASLLAGYKSLWWLNYILLLGALVYAPRSKHLHPLFSFPNIAFRNLAPKGSLRPVDLNKPETIRISKIHDFTWKQLLDGYACTWCGRCQEACPARLSGKPLYPRELILGMKERLIKTGPASRGVTDGAGKAVIGDIISEDALWACTTCRACEEVCPSCNEPMRAIIDLRRHLQMVATTETARDVLKNIRVRGHPWRGTAHARTDWAEGMDIKIIGEDSHVDMLYWVGCTEALEDRSFKVAKAVAGLMKRAGVDFGILGEEEMCCGDPARRLGAEHIFQTLAANNIQLLSSYKVKKIVTACPHCFNTLKNEYPQFGGRFQVVHHSELIADLVRENRLKMDHVREASITYQDPCYLGRYNDTYHPARHIFKSIPGLTLVEMAANRKNGLCCGGGGGRMWLEEATGRRINEIRLSQATATRAQVLATACPFCLQMFEDAARADPMGDRILVKDVAEIAAEACGAGV